MTAEEERGIQVGDRIKFSVALLRLMYDMPEHQSDAVEVVRIERDEAGVILLHLAKIK